MDDWKIRGAADSLAWQLSNNRGCFVLKLDCNESRRYWESLWEESSVLTEEQMVWRHIVKVRETLEGFFAYFVLDPFVFIESWTLDIHWIYVLALIALNIINTWWYHDEPLKPYRTFPLGCHDYDIWLTIKSLKIVTVIAINCLFFMAFIIQL